MSATQRLLRDTLESILAHDDTFPARFYEILFERHPEVRELFVSSSPNVQRLKFAQSLTWIVDHADEPDALKAELTQLARSHVSYGVSEPMYAFVGDALIQTLREALGAEFTPEAELAWTNAFAMISETMRAAARTTP